MPPGNCPYADRQYCDNIEPHHCYNVTVRTDCCSACVDNEINIEGCLYGDRYPAACDVIPAWDCYNGTILYECCDTCDGYGNGPPGCRFGDMIPDCRASNCKNYSTDKRRDCCATCLPPSTYQSTPSTTYSAVPTTNGPAQYTTTITTPGVTGASGTQRSSSSDDWVIPVGAAAGGLLLVVIFIGVFIYCRRRKMGPKHLSPSDERMYNEYKISKRAPVAPPRPLSDEPSQKGPQGGEETYNYAYVEPNEIPKPVIEKGQMSKRKGDDPLPPTPGGNIDVDKYGYFQPLADNSNPSNGHVPNSSNTEQPKHLTSTHTSLVQPSDGKDHAYSSRYSEKMKL